MNALSLRVPEGCVYGFLGRNGAGKSTTMRVLAGVLPPSSGTVQVQGVDASHDPSGVRALVGFLLIECLAQSARLRGVADPCTSASVAVEPQWRMVSWGTECRKPLK